MTFLDICRRLHHFCGQLDLPPPKLTLTFETSLSARRAWNAILDEFPEWSIYPTNRPALPDGEAVIHGIPIKIEPMP